MSRVDVFAFLVLASAASPTLAQPYAQRVRGERACDSQTFSVEAALWAPALPADFAADLQSRLSSGLNPVWFGCPTCAASAFRARVEAVLPDYSNAGLYPSTLAARRDGHRRFFQVSFERVATGARVPVVPSQGCDAVRSIRVATASALGRPTPAASPVPATQPEFLVGRSCDAVVLDSEAWVSPATQRWAQERLGAAPLGGALAVPVALVDTGVPSGYGAGLGVVAHRPLPSFQAGAATAFHPHGAQMAALIRSVAPNAQLTSYRALDENGVGSIASVARALDDALDVTHAHQSSGRAPLIVNLSLGVPPDFTRPSLLSQGTCSTWEDGQGESLRYVLDLAAELDATVAPVIVVAAGGNQVLERASTAATPWVSGTAPTPCGIDAAAPRSSSFYPAGFGERASCRAGGAARVAPVLVVGATDYRDLRSSLTIAASEPFLFAPGERVFAASSALPAAPTTIGCASTEVGRDRGFESPAVVSGTSASAALTSGALAVLLGRSPTIPNTSTRWRAASLARLLYLSGEPGCGVSSTGASRRLSLARLDHVLTRAPTSCASLVSCAASVGSGGLLTSSTWAGCSAAASACFATRAPRACGSFPAEPDWEPGHYSSVASGPSACVGSVGTTALTAQAIFAPNANSVYPDLQLAGLGPLPVTGACPNCKLIVTRVPGLPGTLTLNFELSDAFAPGTLIRDAYLVGLDSSKLPVWIGASNGATWAPGQVGRVDIPGATPAERGNFVTLMSTAGASASLDVAVTSASGRTARVVSPVTVILR